MEALTMGMDADITNDGDDADTNSSSLVLVEGLANGDNGVEESSMLREMLRSLGFDLSYASEKLGNLDLYVTIVSLGDNGLGEMLIQSSSIAEIDIEKALVFDHSLGYLESEIAELGQFLNTLRINMVDAHQKLHSFWKNSQKFTAFQEKVHAYECSRKHLQEQLSGLKSHVSDMGGSFLKKKNIHNFEDVNHVTFEMPGSDLQAAGQQMLVLKMLDKSLSGELDLEEKLLKSREREEELESKLAVTNTVVSQMDSFAEFALERLLQAEHSSVVFMGMAKEMMSHLQVVEFNMHCSVQREEELKFELEQLKGNQISLIEIEDSDEKSIQSSEDQTNLEEKVKVLEQKLQSSESKLHEMKVSYEISQEQLSLLENTIETLENDVFMADTRAHIAELTFTALTEENIELKEEVTFLKDGDSNVQKISLLEKQLRELEVQLQTAKSSSEASHEQQSMLYTAIWDMETLIEELRTKAFKAENRADNAEKECLALAETNLALNKEITYLKSNSDKLERSLKESNKVKVTWVKDINSGAKLVTEMVVQLTSERERIQKQMSSFAKENKILLEELRRMRKIYSVANQDGKEFYGKESSDGVDTHNTGINVAVSIGEDAVQTSTSMTASNQDDQDVRDEAETSSSSTSDDAAAANITNVETETKAGSRHINKKCYSLAAIIVLLLSMLALNINWQYIASTIAHQYLDFE